MLLNANQQERLHGATGRIVKDFTEADWRELSLGLDAKSASLINNHPRLLRSLSWGDSDYSGHVISVLQEIVNQKTNNLELIENYIGTQLENVGINVSTVQSPDDRRIVFAPSVFRIPEDHVDYGLLSVMMPFDTSFSGVYAAIQEAARRVRLQCLRASDIWEDSRVIQDIFTLIFRSFIVVSDFTSKNPNVFYETGIAHTLGKHVIPITQSEGDVPFDLRQHRFLLYLNNDQGRNELTEKLAERFRYLVANRR